MRRTTGTLTLLFTSVSAILGSGWLFAAYYTTTIAGPAALLAWIIAGICIAFVAMVFVEINTMLPLMGASTRIPHITHGTLVGFMYSWIIWLCYAAIPPTEVQAIIQYISFYHPDFTNPDASLTEKGYLLATALMLVIYTINAYSLRWLFRSNTTLTIMKILIPVLIIVAVCAYYFEPTKIIHPAGSSFLPFGLKGVFAAISTGGIVYAFNGFTQACDLSGTAKNPGFSLPFAIIGSIFVTFLIYIGLQVALLTSITPHNLLFGWTHLQLDLQHAVSPLAAILKQDNLHWLIPILFIGAIVGPFAASLIYTSTAAQSLRNKSINGYLPSFLQKITKNHTPIYALLINFCFGMCIFAPLPGWNKMISFLTSLMTLTYTIGPLCLIALRDQAPNTKRPFKLPFGKIWATIAFYFCTMFSYFNGWEIISKLFLAFIFGFFVLIIYRRCTRRDTCPPLDWRTSIWIWPYIGGLTFISYLGSFGGGKNILPFGIDLVVLAIFSLCIVWLANKFKLSPEASNAHMAQALKE